MSCLCIKVLTKENTALGIFVDIMKAFHTVYHEILLSKMYDAGIREILLKWFRSFLKRRIQKTKIDNVYSFPQGVMLLGPLFLIYVMDF